MPRHKKSKKSDKSNKSKCRLVQTTLTETGNFRFLALPPEIRNMIYDWVFARDLGQTYKIMGSTEDTLRVSAPKDEQAKSAKKKGKVTKRVSALLVCRQIYKEAAANFYASTTFSCSSTNVLFNLLGRISENVKYVQRIEVYADRGEKLSTCLKILLGAPNLAFLRLRPYRHGHDDVAKPADFKVHYNAHHTASLFQKLLEALQRKRNNRQAVIDMVCAVDEGGICLAESEHRPHLSPGFAASRPYAQWREEVKVEVSEYLKNINTINGMFASMAKVVKKQGLVS